MAAGPVVRPPVLSGAGQPRARDTGLRGAEARQPHSAHGRTHTQTRAGARGLRGGAGWGSGGAHSWRKQADAEERGWGSRPGGRALLGVAWRGRGALQAPRDAVEVEAILDSGGPTVCQGRGAAPSSLGRGPTPDPRPLGLSRGTVNGPPSPHRQVEARALGPRHVGARHGLRTPAGSPQPRHVPRMLQFSLDNRAHQGFLMSVPRKGVAPC